MFRSTVRKTTLGVWWVVCVCLAVSARWSECRAEEIVASPPLIVPGRLAVGFAATAGETFPGGVHVLIKTTGPHLRFEDTTSMPHAIWSISADEQAFRVSDSTGFAVTTIQNGVPENSFVIRDDGSGSGFGKVGFGVGDPLADLHVRRKFDASLRLETVGGGMEAAQTWNLSGNAGSFSISDITGNTTPFAIEPGASDSALYVNAAGCVGLGTTAPDQILHAVSGHSPTIRLEQDVSEGGRAQVWDVFGNQLGIGVMDVTGGSTTPFFVVSGAPEFSLMVGSNGNIGLGTVTPSAGLHLRKPAQSATAEIMARFETTDDPIGGLFISNNSAGDGLFIPKITGRSASQNAALINEAIITSDVGASPAIAYNAALGAGGALAVRPLVVYRNNSVAKVTIAANGAVTATSFNPVSSRSLKHDIKDLNSQEAADAVRQLTPVEFIYNDDESGEKRVGFIAEDVPEIVANADRQSVPIMDVLALVTKVVKDQQATINELKTSNNEQKKLNEELMRRLSQIEGRLTETK